jgi:hypothetical protein
MANFEGFNQRATSNRLYSVPTLAMRNGDFSSLLPRLGAQLYYPTGRSRNANGTYNVTPIPGNIIPASAIVPQSLLMLNYLPAPNQPIPANQSPVNDYLLNANNPTDKDQFNLRIDWVESSKSSWFARYSWTDETAFTPTLSLAGNTLATNAKQYMISNTRVFSPTAVNDFRFGINSFYNAVAPNLACKQNVVGQLGLPGLNSSLCQTWGIPNMRNLGEISGWGDDTNGPYILNDAIGQVIDSFSWVRGKHAFRFGGEVRRDRYNQLGNEFPRGAFNWGSLLRPTRTTTSADMVLQASSLALPHLSTALMALRLNSCVRPARRTTLTIPGGPHQI